MITSVRLPEEIEKKLEMLVEMTGKKKSSFIIEALRDHLDDLEVGCPKIAFRPSPIFGPESCGGERWTA